LGFIKAEYATFVILLLSFKIKDLRSFLICKIILTNLYKLFLLVYVFYLFLSKLEGFYKMKIPKFVFVVLVLLLVQLCAPYYCEAQVTASFTTSTSSGCAPLNVSFNNTSSGATSYAWNFGNGNTSTATSPGAIFSIPGTFTVTLTATTGGTSNVATATITVFSNPIASFTTSLMPSCPGQPVTFTDNSTQGNGALTTWSWDFGDGNAQANAPNSVSHTYGSAASFPVTMIVTDANGCSNSTIKPVTISPTPVASFTANPISACAPPLLVNFNSTSTITGAATYAWTFGDGNTSTAQNPTNTYNTSGGFNVSLTVTQGACTNTKTSNNFIGIQNIVADFSADNTAVCEGYSVTFTDLSFPITASQSWDFGDGSTSTTTNPTHVYATAGTYSVTLVEGSGSCQNTVTKASYITVSPSPSAAFSASQTQSCSVPFAPVFSNTSTPGCIYTWDFGDGSAQFTTGSTSSFSYSYSAPGTDSVTLLVTSGNGCVTTLKKLAYIVISDPAADFSADVIQGCVPLPVTFTDASTASSADPIVSYKWNFGNGTATTATPSTTNTYNALGTYTVSLVIQTAGGCKDSITKTNYIKTGTKPTANFSIVDPTVCYGTDAVFTDLSVGADSAYWEFDVNEGTFSTPAGASLPFNPVTNLFPDTGTFYVQQIAFNHGCADTLKINNIVQILPPKPIFSSQLSCTNLFTVSLTDASLAADSLIWDFGDGSPLVINDTIPTHTYASRGDKTITLTAYNFSTGCHSSAPQTLTIAQPIARFSTVPSKGCYPLVVTLNDSSQDADDFVWKFGDGSPAVNLPSPVLHVYTAPKQDTAMLIVTDVNGCKDSTTRIVTVYGPTPNFNSDVTTGCIPLLVTFNDTSISDSALVQWTWDFGDGTAPQTVNTASTSHIYTVTGFYSVTMTVSDINGCTKTVVRPNYIQPTYPSPAFVVDTFACRNEVVTFDASASNAAGPATYSWNYGDGTTGLGIISVHAYATSNTYTVTLTVTDINGCDSSIQHQILIEHPVTGYTDSVLLIGCGVTNMQFTDHSTGTSLTNWQWNFGDGASATQQNPVHTYTLPATYAVSLVVTNVAGCTDTITQSVAVPGPTGTFSFTPSAACPPLTATFTAVSATAISYTWDFGDGNVVTTATPVTTHTYPTDIVATPALLLGFILPDGSTCQLPAPAAGTITVVTVFPTVGMTSDVDSGCFPITVNFNDLSTLPGTIPGDSINSWVWNFGDGTTSTLQNPSHTYPQAGNYSVSLAVTSKGGCSNNSSLTPLTIKVNPYPIAAFSLNSNTFDLPFDVMNCTNQSAGAITYAWDFGDGTSSTATNPSYLYTTIGTFQVQLIANNQFGCKDTAVTSVITNADVIFPNAFTPSPDGSTGGEYVMFSTTNDIFFPYTAGVTDFKFSIFDRWGELVFESLDIKKGWDGYYKGKLCEQGVYVWKAYIKLNNGKEHNKSGDVTLLR
jgi:gliding motility-associated-like protein